MANDVAGHGKSGSDRASMLQGHRRRALALRPETCYCEVTVKRSAALQGGSYEQHDPHFFGADADFAPAQPSGAWSGFIANDVAAHKKSGSELLCCRGIGGEI